MVGGAGYIGSHMVDYLQAQGYRPIVLDNLSTGHIDSIRHTTFIQGDIIDNKILNEVFSKYPFSAVMHFASYIQVGESVTDPAKYYQNNFSGVLNLLQHMLKWRVKKIIFSSTAAIYGVPLYTPIDENHSQHPINPYGHSKKMVEQVLQDFSRAYGLQHMILRYFNAAGRKPSSHLYEHHDPETHLIPLILDVVRGKRDAIKIYGTDYDTPDGTCIRDYVHVLDLCSAHQLALEQLLQNHPSEIYNLGTNQGYSVKQVIDIARKITQHAIPVLESARRAGDPAVLVADASKAKKLLNWKPVYSDIETIIQHAYQN